MGSQFDLRFGTSGIRGLSMEEISPEVCHIISKALGVYFDDVAGEGRTAKVAIGYDTRPHAGELAGYCANAMTGAGIEVINLGIISSPHICASILMDELDGALIVTGSHLSYDRIGLIPLGSDGTIPPSKKAREIEKLVREQPVPGPEEIKSQLPPEIPLDMGEYVRFIKEVAGITDSLEGVKVTIDPAGATGAGIVSGILKELGCEVIAIHDTQTDLAPRRMEPRLDSVGELCDMIKNTGADMGAAYDSDCDRVLFLDENSIPLSEDLAAAIFAKYIYKCKGGNCVTPINSSGLIKRVWEEDVIDCIIGPPEISEAIRVNDGIFGYEESGKYFFPPKVLWADGIVATVMLARVLKETGKKLSDLVHEFPRHDQIKKNVWGTREQMEYISKHFPEVFDMEDAELLDIDGLKYIYPDGSWLLIRPSGTEPLMRVYVDSPSPERAKELSDEGVRLVEQLMEESS